MSVNGICEYTILISGFYAPLTFGIFLLVHKNSFDVIRDKSLVVLNRNTAYAYACPQTYTSCMLYVQLG